MAEKDPSLKPTTDPVLPPSVPASTEKTDADKQSDARQSIGGQGQAGSKVEGDEETITSDELKNSKQPKAPEHPLEIPKPDLEDVVDQTQAAPKSEVAPKEAVVTNP